MIVRITRVELVEVSNNGGDDIDESPVDMNDFNDSMMNHILDSQDNVEETSDQKFLFEPKEIVSLKCEVIE